MAIFQYLSCYNKIQMKRVRFNIIGKAGFYQDHVYILVSIVGNHFQCWHTYRNIYIRLASLYKRYHKGTSMVSLDITWIIIFGFMEMIIHC